MPATAAATAAVAFLLLAAALPAAAEAQTSNQTSPQTRWDRGYVADVNVPPAFARNRAAQCVNGYRTTHQVHGNGKVTAGVILKCRN